jgi:hypothetical protein
LQVRTAAEEKLEIAKRIENDKLIQMNSYDIPLKRTSKATNSKVYSRMPGEDVFADIGLPFCHSTGMDLSQLQLKILQKGLKTYGFPAAHSLSQANQASSQMWNDICTTVGIQIELPSAKEDNSGEKCPRCFACLPTESHASWG